MRAKIRQLGRESLIYGIAGMLNKFIAVFLVPVYTHTFSRNDYGHQGLIVTAITLASTVVVLGMDSASHNWYWQTECENDRRVTIATWFWCQLSAAALIAAAIAGGAGPLSALLTGDAAAAPLLRLAALTLPLGVTHAVVTNYFRLRRMARATLWYSVITNLLIVGLTVLLITGLHRGLEGFFLAQVLSGCFTTLAGAVILRGAIHPGNASLRRLREMLPYAFPLMPAAIAFWAIGFADRIFVEKLQNTEEVAVYQFAVSLASAVSMLTGAFSMAWGPFALSMQRQPDAPALYAKILPLYLAVSGAAVAGLALFSQEAARWLAPSAYAPAAAVAPVLALGVLANGLSCIAATGLSLARRSAPVTAAVSLAAAVNMVLNLLCIPRFGLTGAAWAAGLSWAVYTGYIFRRAQQIHPIPYNFRRATLIAALVTAAATGAPRIPFPSHLSAILVKPLLALLFLGLILTIALPGWTAWLRRRPQPAA